MSEYGSKFDLNSNENWRGDGLNIDAAYYRSGRDALRALAAAPGKRPTAVLLPALCCKSMVLPFVQCGIDAVFYRMSPVLTGDKEDLLSKLRDGALLIYMSYFGIRPFETEFLERLRTECKDLRLVEDRTHDIIVPRPEGSFRPDAMLASVRKWAALPEGGMLVMTDNAFTEDGDRRFGDMQKLAMEKKSRFLQGSSVDSPEDYLDLFHRSEELLDDITGPQAISDEYLSFIRTLDFPGILERRRRNIAALKELLTPAVSRGGLRFLSPRPEDSTLYFPVLLDDRDAIQQALARQRIYCPVIWPSPEGVKGLCAVTDYTVAHMLALPCDQRYDERDMGVIAGALIKALD